MSIIGQQKLVDFFDVVLREKKIAQSYCLVGPDQIGKRKLARYLAAKLLSVTEEQLDTHPDFYFLKRGFNEKNGKLKKDISIEQARRLKIDLSKRSWMGFYKVAVIDEAELLNQESGNALLKILEDEKPNTVLFLLTVNEGALLPTIKSRCQLFYLTKVPDQQIAENLKKSGHEHEVVKEAVSLAAGLPGRAIDLANNAELRNSFTAEKQRWQKIIGQPFHSRLTALDDLLKEKEGPDREKLASVLEVWQTIWRDALKDKVNQTADSDKIFNTFTVEQISSFIDKLKNAKIMLRQNVGHGLIFEELLLFN